MAGKTQVGQSLVQQRSQRVQVLEVNFCGQNVFPPSEVVLGRQVVQCGFGYFPPSEVLQGLGVVQNQAELFGFGLLASLVSQGSQRIQVLEVNRWCQKL